MPRDVLGFFEPRFGHDFSRVRVHTDVKAAEAARSVKARAYTVGHDIVFGTGQYSPQTESGRGVLAHELAHTIQQNASGKQHIRRLCADHPNESYYRNGRNFCMDTDSTGSMHPNHRCYREIPTGPGCPSGEHVCFRRDTGVCDATESHRDDTAPSISRTAGGTCDLSWLGGCTILHGILDVVGPTLAPLARGLGPPSTDPESTEFKMWLRYHRR